MPWRLVSTWTSLSGCLELTFRSLGGGPSRRAMNRWGAISCHRHNCCLDINCSSVGRWKFRVVVENVSWGSGSLIDQPGE